MKLLLITSFFLTLFNLVAQQKNSSTFVPLSEVEEAKELAYQGNYSQSIQILEQQTNLESQQLLARVYAWSHQYEKSIKLCEQLIQEYPEVVSHYQVAATTALWGGMWSACYGYAEAGSIMLSSSKQKDGDKIAFGVLQIKALMGQKKWREAEELCTFLLISPQGQNDVELKNQAESVFSSETSTTLSMTVEKEVENLLQKIQQAQFQKEIIINHSQDYFTLDSSRWKNTSVILKNKTKYGPLLISAHHSNRFDLEGLQGEIEFYPKIDSNYYAYIDLGFSGSELFPNFRNGISVFRAFNKGFEAELGYRNLQFKAVGNVWFYLGSITKYFGNNSLNYRLTSIHSPDGSSATHGLKFTHYLDEHLSYLSIELGSGTNARDYQAYSSFKPFSNINSKRVQVDYKKFLNHRFAVKISGAYENALYRENQQGERYTFGGGINYQF